MSLDFNKEYFKKNNNIGLYDDILSDLSENLHRWKRVDGDEFPEANEHFYNVVFSKKRLAAISKITGYNHPDWGSIVDRELYGGKRLDKPEWVTVGLRWTKNYEDWVDAGTPIRYLDSVNFTKYNRIRKPQIVVTVRPIELCRDMIESSGSCVESDSSKRHRPISHKCRKHKLWPKAKVIPLFVYIPFIGKITNFVENMTVVPNEHSLFYDNTQPKSVAISKDSQIIQDYIKAFFLQKK